LDARLLPTRRKKLIDADEKPVGLWHEKMEMPNERKSQAHIPLVKSLHEKK
jgi:hypothetical protein